MLSIKLVVIGDSSVGKTSLRTKYISGRFANGYRATIGADFITKTIPHPTIAGEFVTLQIWDTAGQERFSSLSSAFFRGADAVLLMYDVNNAQSLLSLTKWWAEFRDRAPVHDEDTADFCCAVVGNKTDLLTPGASNTVTEEEARHFMAQLIPLTPSPPASPHTLLAPQPFPPSETLRHSSSFVASTNSDALELRRSPSPRAMAVNSIAIAAGYDIPSSGASHARSPTRRHPISKSRSRSSSRFLTGTMSTARTALSIYHTPSSSFFSDDFHSARSSFEASSSPGSSFRPRRKRSDSDESSLSIATITPSLFTRDRLGRPSSTDNNTDIDTATASPTITSPGSSTPRAPPRPDRGPKLFRTSAKSGEGVQDVFAYIAQRVVAKWAYDESIEAGRLHFRDASAAETIRLDTSSGVGGRVKGALGSCC